MARRINQTLTVASGTPINLATGTSTAPTGPPLWAWEYFIQMAAGGSGMGKVFDGVPISRAVVAGDITAQLAPAVSATSPGGVYSNTDFTGDRNGIDINEIWVDGTHTADTILTSWVPKV